MSRTGTYFDLVIVESLNGGEIQQVGKDLAIVTGKENFPYLNMFSGNVDQSNWWGNTLIFSDFPERQYKSLTEFTLDNTPLTSAGRATIENAIRKDLIPLKPSLVRVSIISDNHVSAFIKGDFGETIINFKKRSTGNGDFFFMDFNDDFF